MTRFPSFTKTFLAFLSLILLILLVSGTVMNAQFVRYAEGEIGQTGIGYLKISRNICDRIQRDIMNETVRLSANKVLNGTLSQSLDTGAPATVRNSAIQVLYRFVSTTLNESEQANEEVDSIYVYLEDVGKIVSRRYGTASVGQFCDTAWLAPYQEMMEGEKLPFWIKSRIPFNPEFREKAAVQGLVPNNTPVVTFVYPLRMYTSTIRGAIVVNLNLSAFSGQINGEVENGYGSISVIDGTGALMIGSDDGEVGADLSQDEQIRRILSSSAREGYLLTGEGGSQKLVTWLKTSDPDWIYLGTFDTGSLTNRMLQIQRTMFLVMGALLILGAALAFYLSRKLNNPVSKLVAKIKEHRGIDVLDDVNEVSVLTHAIEGLIRQETTLTSVLERQRREVRDARLLSLLEGNLSEEALETAASQFPNAVSWCLLVVIDQYASFHEVYSSEHRDSFKEAILRMFEELLGDGGVCCGVKLEAEKMALVYNTTETAAEVSLKVIGTAVGRVREELSRILYHPVTVSVGDPATAPDQLPTSFATARERLAEKLVSGNGALILPGRKREDARRPAYPFQQERHLINHLETGDKQAIMSTVQAFIEALRSDAELSEDHAMLSLNQLLGAIVRFLLDQNVSLADVLGTRCNVYHQLLENETLDDVGLWLTRICLAVSAHLQQKRTTGRKYIEVVMEKIHRQYRTDIDVNALAAELGISYAQLRRAFLAETGMNIVNYVNNLRIEEARHLLRGSTVGIAEIAEHLGYNNIQSFNRFFKKYEGMPPGEYRKNPGS